MKKILFIIPFILLLTACGELLPETGGTTNPSGGGGSTTNPGGDGGSTIDPGGDGGSTTNPGGDGGSIINPGGDGGTDPVDPGGDGDGGGTTTEPVFDYTKDPFKANLYYGRSLLTTDNERNAYDLIMKTFLEFDVNEGNQQNARIGVKFIENNINITYAQLLNILTYVLYDEQRLTYLITSSVPRGLPAGAPSRPAESNGFVVEAYFDVMGNLMSAAKAIYNRQTEIIESGVSVILDKIQPDMNEGHKFRLLHDEFIKSVSYGQLTQGVRDIRGGFGPNKKVLCEGYARSLAYLCQRAGLEVIYIVGTASYSGTGDNGSGSSFNHAWIKVKIDGQWYNVDPTNNDGMIADSDAVFYNNFLQSDAEFMKDHKEGYTTDNTKTSYDSFPASAPYSYDKDATNYP